jgi:predicted lysophospholipase L1 biosynthesis ABC-type transport system permease subunit
MPKNCFDRLIDWPHHPAMIMILGFASGLIATLSGDTSLWSAVIAAALLTLPICLLLFIPYVVSVWVLAALLALLQAIRARFRHPSPATR